MKAKIEKDKLKISGSYFNITSNFSDKKPIGIYMGRHTEKGELLKEVKFKASSPGSGNFSSELKLTEEIKSYLNFGGIYIQIDTEKGNLRAQLLPVQNKAPEPAKITSHHSKNTYGIRDIEALYEMKWSQAVDKDGDFVSYIYQLSPKKRFFRNNSSEKNR